MFRTIQRNVCDILNKDSCVSKNIYDISKNVYTMQKKCPTTFRKLFCNRQCTSGHYYKRTSHVLFPGIIRYRLLFLDPQKKCCCS